MENKKGKFIVIYGVNNLGKTTQAKMLADRLNSSGYKGEYRKYAVYDLEPAGKLINGILRHGNPYNFSAREKQLLHYIDRVSFEPILKNKLDRGINIIAEDYFGTAVAWGIAAGVDPDLLKYLYSFVYPEDMAFIFNGERFKASIEKVHYYETNENLINKARIAHLEVGREYGWHPINANSTIAQIHEILWAKVMNLIEKPVNYFIAPNFKELHDRIYTHGPQTAAPTSRICQKPPDQPAKISVQRLSPVARLPQKNTAGGYDLFAVDYYSIPPQRRAEAKTGIKIIIPNGYTGITTKTSSLKENKIHVLTAPIDSDREITVDIINFGHSIYSIVPGDKIARVIIQKTENMEVTEIII